MQVDCTARKRKMHEMHPMTGVELSEMLKGDEEEPSCCNSLVSSCDNFLAVSEDQCVSKHPCVQQEEGEISNVLIPHLRLPQYQKDNLCLFFAALNVLDVDKQVAFSKGEVERPEKAFLEWTKNNEHIRGRDPTFQGYNFKDLHAYLQHLLKEKYISHYVWKNLSKWRKIPSQLLFGDKLRNSRALIISGIAPSTDLRSKLLNQLKKCTNSFTDNSDLEKQKGSVYIYQQFSFKTQWNHTNSSHHAIGVRQINGQSFIFDSGRRSAIKLNTVADIAWSFGQCCDWYEFDIII
jgi:hypothetical protein